MRWTKFILAGVLAAFGLSLVLHVEAQTVGGVKTLANPPVPPPDLRSGLIAETKLDEKIIDKVLKALPKVASEQLRGGRSVELTGIGTLQVVRVTEYKDLVNGRPALMPAHNYIEFVPTEKMNQDANAPGAKPARVVEGFEFRINPNANPGIRTPSTRNPGGRIR